ncbi:MAG TPA: threonine ammonia-lyase IlvA [Chitinophagales bacterium]|nr:threonine ammonia-lyase IlvA [Chitinophagales bacterium]HNB48702.1 threonine ammonia-lyase IlvA [Chitinophagales bacterium]HNF18336.1 threonine ammonia-lyase IlvA [Chitinophagales bacterium]HNG71559.1 threonine ammonia-lyase IlvA [Chitinophagales bacterium]HNI32132.1 threonine ammonia-lyase IlvA [Chitinophagales bacterium]
MTSELPKTKGIIQAKKNLEGIIEVTPLKLNQILSDETGAKVYLKREDLQVVRSYKIRGAYNFISQLTKEQKKLGVVCASAGNHAQGFAYSCQLLKIHGVVFMPSPTPRQKIDAVRRIGKNFIEVILSGDTYDDAKSAAQKYISTHKKILVPPFDHTLIIEGQGTVAMEILEQIGKKKIDYLFVPIGGGGLAAGLITYFKEFSPNTKIVGVEPLGAPAMKVSLEKNKVVTLSQIDNFVDGAAVKQVGQIPFQLCKKNLEEVVLVPEGRVCTKIMQLYNSDAIVLEPAGALSIAALDYYKDKIKGKNVVCVISGGNNDIGRMPDIKERSLIFEGLKHFFIIKFPQRAGALRQFVTKVLSANEDITLFEYTKKNSKESGPALVGIELKYKDDYDLLIKRMKKYKVDFVPLNDNPMLFNFLI